MLDSQQAREDLPAVADAAEFKLLVDAIAAGDSAAEEAFVARFLPLVRAMLITRARNPDIAQDLLQDVMLGAICALRKGQLRDPARLSWFVRGIARNHLNEHFRGKARQTASIEFPDRIPDLSTQRDDAEMNRRETLALAGIERLDPTDKAILQLTLVDGMKPGKIAELLKLSSDVVRQRKLRATRRLIQFVENQSQKLLASYSSARRMR
jgi:RNA polymerase sigma-70 factor (ECF subfamily)